MLLNPNSENYANLDQETVSLLKATIGFFEQKGKTKLKSDDHERLWYDDFLKFNKAQGLFKQFLTPSGVSRDKTRWDTYRNCFLNEILGFYGLNYWYTWQVTILGLGPIWMGENEALKKKAAKALADGGIFAFGLSEKEHGADIYTTDMVLTPVDGGFQANGGKYYIGNGNEASLVSVFGRIAGSDDYVFFAAAPGQDGYKCVRNVVNSQNYVAELELTNYFVREDELLCRGSAAWDCSLNTVNVGKFNLGWAAIGMCTHAFYEALNHATKRVLFKQHVSEFVHIKQFFVDAYCRLVAMKMFALRAADYMRVASPEDRRYLLYNPIVKMKITTQGEEVINLLWDIIAAKGFEKDTFFESAARDIRALPKLEGTVHVNMALVLKFMANYFFKAQAYPYVERQDAPSNDDFLFNQGEARGLGRIRFHDYRPVYRSRNLPNIRIFRKQIRLLKLMLVSARPSGKQLKDFDLLLALGEMFTLVVYGQLIIENAEIYNIDDDLLDTIFDFMVRDFTKHAVQLYSRSGSTARQRYLCRRMIKKPIANGDRFERLLRDKVYALTDVYEMRD